MILLIRNIFIGLSIGTIFGFLLGSLKLLRHKKYSDAYQNDMRKLIQKIATLLKYVTFFLLLIGLIWCVYFLLLGIIVPSQADYANNMSELIVSVLTVVSIIFAFIEFLNRDKQNEKVR